MKKQKAVCVEVLKNGALCGNDHLLSNDKCAVHWAGADHADASSPMSAANTPTPWKVWPENTPSITTDRTDAKTQSIARCVEPADAAFIVRAVNSFQSLVDSLQQIANLPNNEHAVKIAQSAIAKAEGK